MSARGFRLMDGLAPLPNYWVLQLSRRFPGADSADPAAKVWFWEGS